MYMTEPLLKYRGDTLIIEIPNARGRNIDELILAGALRVAVSTYTEPGLFADLESPVFDGPTGSDLRKCSEKPCEDSPMAPKPNVLPCSPAPTPQPSMETAENRQKRSEGFLMGHLRNILPF